MNINSSLLESVLLLAILKRERDRRKKQANSMQHPLNVIKVSGDEICEKEELYDSEDSDNSNENTFSINNSENDEIQPSEPFVTTYSFNKETNTLVKNLISSDNAELKNVRDLTSRMLNRRTICDICGKSYNEKNLKFHMNKHNNNYPFKCNVNNCKRAFTSAQMLKQHLKFHCEEKRLKCEFCDRSFYMPNSLKNHRLLHFDPTMECQECGRMLHTKSSLKIHYEKAHLGIKKYVCKICDKRYSNHGSLRKHLVVIHKHKFTSQRIVK